MNDRPLVCVEVGGSGSQSVTFDGGAVRIDHGVTVRDGADIAVAVPGLIADGRVLVASNLGWHNVDPGEELGLPSRPVVVRNDAEAAALGEWVLRGCRDAALLYVGLGTGVGGAVVADGHVVAENLLGHVGGFGERRCTCGRRGCLESVAGGWALPEVVPPEQIPEIARWVADAVRREPPAAGVAVVVVTGGLTDAYPALVGFIAGELPDVEVVASARPEGTKSAAAWGLRLIVDRMRTGDLS